MVAATAFVARRAALFTIVAAAIFGLLFTPSVHAQTGYDPADPFGIQATEDGVGDVLSNRDIRQTAGDIIKVALSLLGIIAVVIVLIGGFQWMTAGGNDDKVAGARKLIFSGIIGLAIIFSAWAIASFVINSLQTATGSGLGEGLSE